MRDFRLGLTLLTLLLCVAAAMAETAPAISGKVLGPDGEPVAGADVFVRSTAKRHARNFRTTSGEDGTFAISAEAAEGADDPLIVRVVAPGLAPFHNRETPVGAQLTVRLRGGKTLEGLVRDQSSGKPLGGATVFACDDGGTTFAGLACQQGSSDDEGRFEVAGLGESLHSVAAVAASHAHTSLNQRFEPGAELPPLFLQPGGRVAGRVVDKDDVPVHGAVVRYRPTESSMRQIRTGPPLHATDEDGRFDYRGLQTGHYRFSVEKKGYARMITDPIEITVGLNDDERAFVIGRGGELAFRLMIDEETPFDGEVEVQLKHRTGGRPGSDWDRRNLSATGDKLQRGEEGRVEMDAIGAGAYDLVIRPDGYNEIERGDLLFAEGKTVDLGRIELDQGDVLRGRVVDEAGEPIGGAIVEVQYMVPGKFGEGRETKSDDAGAFRLGGLDTGVDLVVRAKAKGFERVTLDDVELDGAPLEIRLKPGAIVVGRVEAEDGETPGNIRVQVQPEGDSTLDVRRFLGSEAASPEINQEDGTFRVEELSSGKLTLLVSARGMVQQRQTGIEVEAGETTDVGTIVLSRGLVLQGRVVAAGTGVPIPGASIEAGKAQGMMAFTLGARGQLAATSDVDGRFAISGLEPGAYSVSADHSDFATGRMEIDIAEGAEPVVEIQLSRGGWIVGTVRDRDRNPVAEARIAVMRGIGGRDARSVTTLADGTFRLDKLAPGSYTVMRAPESQADITNLKMKTVVVEEGKETVVDFDEEAPITLRGRVTRGGQPVPGMTMIFLPGSGTEAVGAMAGANFKATAADEFGAYEIGLDRPGPYQVMVTDQTQMGRASGVQLTVPDEPVVEMDVELGSAAIVGTVRDEEGNPVAGVAVSVIQAGGGFALSGMSAGSTDANGAFRLEGMEPGTYDLGATVDGYAPVSRVVEVSEGEVRVDLQLERGAPFVGLVVDPNGAPVASAVARISQGGAITSAHTALTDASGSFNVALTSGEPVNVVVAAGGYAPARWSGMPPQDEVVTIRLDGGVTLNVLVTDAQGNPVSGATVAVSSADPLMLGLGMLAGGGAQVTDAGGRARLRNVGAGAQIVTVQHQAGAGRQDVVVEGTGEAETTVVLQPGG